MKSTNLLIVSSLFFVSALAGCNGDRVGPEVMKKLEGGTVVRMDTKFFGSDAIIIKSKGGCEWRINTPKGKNNLYVKPVDKSCTK